VLWGRKYGGWLDWPEVLDHARVVLLAEAQSGKTEEFKHAAAGLRETGHPAFYATIEQLADGRLNLSPAERTLFDTWKAGSERAWFFLDSVDEARLNRRKFDDAAGRHLAPDAFAGEVLPGRDLFRLYLVPIAFELFGDELDKARDRALSHLRTRDTDHAGVVGFDENPRVDLGAFVGALSHGGTEGRRQIESECESTACGGGADDERPARKPRGFAADRLCHGRPP
jgi:hypothetical protein